MDVVVANSATFLISLWFFLEHRQMRKVLAWTDRRDAEFARLYIAASKLELIPKNNPLAGFKEHGMLSKNAIMVADQLLPAIDERLDVLGLALTSVSREAKALATWERAHPIPPKHWWQKQPKPVVEPTVQSSTPTYKELNL